MDYLVDLTWHLETQITEGGGYREGDKYWRRYIETDIDREDIYTHIK